MWRAIAAIGEYFMDFGEGAKYKASESRWVGYKFISALNYSSLMKADGLEHILAINNSAYAAIRCTIPRGNFLLENYVLSTLVFSSTFSKRPG